jgi:hypothetical protein
LVSKVGRTVENTLKNKLNKWNHKEQHITQSCFIGGVWVGLLKNTLRQMKGITKEQHITQSLLSWVGRTVEKILLRPNQRKESQRAAHHSIPAF